MTKQEQLAKAISIAVKAHEGQFDKGGNPYILHPLHLMNQLRYDIDLAIIAVLHDVLEDNPEYDLNYLKSVGFGNRVLSAIELLTHKDGQTYEDYIDNICNNYDAIRVKRKDLEHNSDITRLKGIRPKDIERIEKYHKAFLKLGKAKDNFK